MSRRRGRDDLSGGVSLGRRLLVAGASAFAVLAIAAMLAGLWAVWAYKGAGPAARAGDETVVILQRGSSLPAIAAELEQSGAVRSAPVFILFAKLGGAARDLKAGEYAFASRAPMADVLGKIRRGETVRRFVTIPEGITAEMAVEILEAAEVLTGSAPVPAEGSILPETYDIRRGEDRAAVLRRMTEAHDRLLAELWAARQPDLPLATPQEAVILASVVEKETGIAAERPRIAAVFVNRLRRGMRLESDPTIIYGITRGRPLGRGIRLSELQRLTPYNTYLINGLPPTPIALPGRDALAAVLSPPDTEELFFVADGTGGHVFAKTYEEHLQNVAAWRRVEAQAREGAAAATPAPPPADPAPPAEQAPDPAPGAPAAPSKPGAVN